MKVTRLELKNWGPHEKKSYTLHGGLIGIVGKNGAGKSNLLQAINYALTGDLNKQKQSRYIRNYGEPDGAKSAVVQLDFTCHGEPVSISRTITETGSKREMVKGDTVIKKAAELDAAIQTMFGVDIESLEQAVFLKQGELARLVKGTPSERFAIFQKLVNLNFLEKRANDIPAIVSALQGKTEDLTPAIESMKQSLADVEVELMDAPNVIMRHVTANRLMSEFSVYSQLLYKCTQDKKTIAALQEQETNMKNRIWEMRDAVAQTCLEFHRVTLIGVQELLEKKNKSYELLVEKKKAYETYCANKKYYDNIVANLNTVKVNLAEFISQHGDVSMSKERENLLKESISAWEALQKAKEEQKSLEQECAYVRQNLKEYTETYNAICEQDDKDQQELQRITYELQKLELSSNAAKVVKEAYKNGDPCPCCGAPLTSEAIAKIDKELIDNARLYEELESKKAELSSKDTAHKIAQAQYNITAAKTRLMSSVEAKQKAANDEETEQQKLVSFGMVPMDEKRIAQIKEELDKMSSDKVVYDALKLKESVLEKEEAQLRSTVSTTPPEEVDDNTYAAAKNELLHLSERYAKALSEQEVANKFQKDKDNISLRLQDIVNATDELTKELTAKEDELLKLLNEANANKSLSIESWTEFTSEAELRDFLQKNLDAATENKNVIDVAVGKKQNYEARIDELKAQQESYDKQLSCARKLSRVKEIIGKKGVLLAYMTDVFNKITSIVQDLLPQLGANFSVRPDPENPCSYLFTRTDNVTSVELPQEMLSGGQAIRLALAMLLACQRVILPDVGLLVLDEPTSHIDADGVASMRNMFLKMNELLCNSEMTVILVDHNTELMESIPNIIKL